MQRTRYLSVLTLLACVALIAAMALTTTGCNNTPPSDQTDKTFTLLIVDEDGKQTTKTIIASEQTVGEALSVRGIIHGEQGPYGLYVKTVNGITVDFDKDGKYWAFYVNGQYAVSGIDKTAIADGATYALKVEK